MRKHYISIATKYDFHKRTLRNLRSGVVIVVLAKMVVELVVAMMPVVSVVSTILRRHLEFNEQERVCLTIAVVLQSPEQAHLLEVPIWWIINPASII